LFVGELQADLYASLPVLFSPNQILRVVEIEKKEDVRRPYIKQLLEPGLKFPLPHRRQVRFPTIILFLSFPISLDADFVRCAAFRIVSFRSAEESSPETDLPPGLKLAPLALDDLQRRMEWSGEGGGGVEGGFKSNGSHAFVLNLVC